MIHIIITIALIGLFVWAVTTFVPMPPKFQQLIYLVGIVAAIVYLLSAFGYYDVPYYPRRR